MKIDKLRERLLQFLLDINDYTDDEFQNAVDMLNDITYDATYNKEEE